MGVHNAPGQLHELAHVAHQQNTFKALRRRLVQGIPDEICTLHHGDAQAVQPVAGEKILAVIAGGQDQFPVSLRGGLS